MFEPVRPLYSVYPIFDAPSAITTQGEEISLHAGLEWHNGIKQSLGVISVAGLVRPRVPVNHYIRVPVSPSGSPDPNLISISSPAGLDPRDLTMLRDASNAHNVGWEYIRRIDEPGAGLIVVGPGLFDYSAVHDDEKLVFTLSNTSLVLAWARVLAAPNVQRFIGAQN